MVSDPGAVDTAILAALRADSALLGYCPGGVVYGIASQGVVNFCLVDREVHRDRVDLFETVAEEVFTYLVKAVIESSSSATARSANVRIRTVLDLNTTLAIDGYALIRPIEEIENVRTVEVDEANVDRRVQHWGGLYEVHVQRREG